MLKSMFSEKFTEAWGILVKYTPRVKREVTIIKNIPENSFDYHTLGSLNIMKFQLQSKVFRAVASMRRTEGLSLQK